MKDSIKKGIGFGLTSGIITTLGLIVGLNSSTNSVKIIIGGILIIAIADSLSDAMGMHISEEYSGSKSKDVWLCTFSTLLFKFLVAISFVIPFLLFNLSISIIISVIWGFGLISVFSFYIPRKRRSVYSILMEHLLIVIIVIFLSYLAGNFVEKIFG